MLYIYSDFKFHMIKTDMGNIQMKAAIELKKSWNKKPCNHDQDWLKEYDRGTETGDYICSVCGLAIPDSDLVYYKKLAEKESKVVS